MGDGVPGKRKKNQRFVPRLYLRQLCNLQEQLIAFDKNWQIRIDNVAASCRGKDFKLEDGSSYA